MSEIIVMFAGTALGIGQPLNAMQLLWLNLVTDIFPGLALGLEPPEPDIMTQPPRDPTAPIVGAADFRRIAIEATTLSASTLSAYGYGIFRYGIGARASTIGFMSMKKDFMFTIQVETFGTGKIADTAIADSIAHHFEFRPAGIIRQFDLRFLPALVKGGFYQKLAAYVYFGRPDLEILPWEATDRVPILQAAKI